MTEAHGYLKQLLSNLRALREKAKGRDGRYGPTTVPSVEWPEPLRVLTPAEGGDGREMPRVAVHS